MHPRLPIILGASGMALFTFGLFGMFYLFPKIVDSMLHEYIDLKEGTMAYEMWKKEPSVIKFNVYFFNVTNPDEVLQGAKPIVTERGPYVYDAHQERVNVEPLDDKDVLKYSLVRYYYFNKSESAPLDEDDIVTMVHSPLLSVVMQVNRVLPEAMTIIDRAVPYLFPNANNNIFMSDKVRNILFEGTPILCTHPATDFICTAMKADMPTAIQPAPNGVDFNIAALRYYNGTAFGPWEMERGFTNSTRGDIRAYKNSDLYDVWEDDTPCNMINGSDYTVYAVPAKVRVERLYSFVFYLCRSLYLNYENETEEFGMKAVRYSNTLGPLNYDSGENSCFCPILEDEHYEEHQICPPNGFADLGACFKAPHLYSYPHYYLGDSKSREYVSGMNPKKELHESYVHIELRTGLPLSRAMRQQYNIEIGPVKDFSLMDNITPGIFPIMWIDDVTVLPDNIVHILTSTFLKIKLVGVLKVTIIVLGLGLGVAGGVLMMKKEELLCFAKSNTSEVIEVKGTDAPNAQSTPPHVTATVDVVNPALEGSPRNVPRRAQILPRSRAASNQAVLDNNRYSSNMHVWHSGENEQ